MQETFEEGFYRVGLQDKAEFFLEQHVKEQLVTETMGMELNSKLFDLEGQRKFSLRLIKEKENKVFLLDKECADLRKKKEMEDAFLRDVEARQKELSELKSRSRELVDRLYRLRILAQIRENM